MRILFAGGGTGGHINPAISIADYISENDPELEALFIGTKHGLETRLVPGAGYAIEYIDICGFDRRNPLKNIEVLKKLKRAEKRCVEIIDKFKPDAVVCTGGYVSGPAAIAAHKRGVPSLIHEQNVYPGLTVKGAERYVSYVAVSFEETVKHMRRKKKCVLTGNPVRSELLTKDYASARVELGLDRRPFVLIFGGSLGAERINAAVTEMLPRLSADGKISLLFGTGERGFAAVEERVAKMNLSESIRVVPYINNMHTVMAAADLVVSRAGAITLSELAVMAKPSVLIPSPNVVRHHQEQNARELEEHGAAIVLTEDALTPELLYKTISDTVGNRELLCKMAENSYRLAKPEALDEIYSLIKKMIAEKAERK